MSTRTLHKEMPLTLCGESQIEECLNQVCPTLTRVEVSNKLLTLVFDSQTIVLPLTSTMTWGQLIKSLKRKGLSK